MKKILLGLFVIVAMVGMISCESSTNPIAPGSDLDNSMAKGNPNAGETAYTCSAEGDFVGFNETNDPDYAVYEYTLWAGQHNDAGTVTITNDDENIYVTYNTNETADLGEVHVYIWDDAADLPSKRPAPGHADYVVENINADSYTVVMPVDLSCGNTYYISTHAALVGNGTDGDEAGTGDNAGETAYAGDASSPDCFDATKGAWWGYATYTVECFYDISGSVYEDANNSSDLEDGEAGFGGLVVNLLDASGAVIASATTANDGSYLFEHVAGGADYSVSVAAGPEGDYLATENAGGFPIVGLSADTADVDFGYVPLYDLSGSVYDDANNNSDDDSEAGLEGILVELLDADGTIIAFTTTDADGNYLFENVVAGGDYSVVVYDGPEGSVATENAGGFMITALGADTSDIDFGFYTEPVVVDVFGCMDPLSLNYNPNATMDDGSCEYDNNGDGDGSGFSETAYMYGNTSFCDDLGSSRWGWAEEIIAFGNGNFYSSSITRPIYAGAGQCDISKGTLVGSVTIDWVSSSAGIDVTVSYSMNAGYYVDATHTWIGDDLPANLIANGGFTVVNENDRVSSDVINYTLPSFPSDHRFYVIAHMEAVD